MSIYLLVLRLVHVFAGIIWGGGTIIMEFFVGRTVEATGDSGREFAGYLMAKLRMHNFMTAMAVFTVLAGILLYWHDSNGFTSPWMHSGSGIGFTIGAIFGLIAFISGAIFGKSTADLAQAGAEAQGKPTPEQLTNIQALQKRIKTVSPIHRYGMILAIIFMSISRYFAL